MDPLLVPHSAPRPPDRSSPYNTHVASIQVTHEIAAASGIEMCQIAFRGPYVISEHTLDPTKHPPGHAATHSNHDPNDFQVGRFPRNLRRSERFLEPDAIKNCGEGIFILHVGWQGPEWRRGSRLSMKEREGKAALRIAQQINEACASMSCDTKTQRNQSCISLRGSVGLLQGKRETRRTRVVAARLITSWYGEYSLLFCT